MIRFATRRPSVVWALSMMIVLAGAVSFTKLPLATRTTVELPRLRVAAGWNGASAEVMEAAVTAPLESAVQGVRGVRRVDSESQDGYATLAVLLEPNTDVQLTRLAILERLELLRTEFPAGVSPPRVASYVPDGLEEQPLLSLSIAGPYTPGTLQRLLDERVTPRLGALPGVAGVSVYGGSDIGVSVSYDATRLRQLGIAPALVTQAVSSARIVQTLGHERRFNTSRPVVLRDQLASIEALLRLPLPASNARVFPLGAIASARAEENSHGSFNRIDGRPAVSVDVSRRPGADAIKTAAALRAAVAALRHDMPAGVSITVSSDESTDLEHDLDDLARRGGIAFLAVLTVLSLLLQRVRTVALIMGSTAVAIAGTALTLFLLDIPANLLTLAGLGMGIGILVQNSIIVVNRLSRVPDTPDERALAAERITPAVLGSTLTTAVVLVPFLYLQGDARSAFVPFAAALVIATLWSVLTALVVVPALGVGTSTRPVAWRRPERVYRCMLQRCLRWRRLTLLATASALVVITWGFVTIVPRSAWGSGYNEGRSTLSVGLSFPRGSDPDGVDRTLRDFEAIVLGRPEVERVRTQGYGETSGNMSVLITRQGALTSAPLELQELLTQRAVLVGSASVYVSGQGPAFSTGGAGAYATFRIKVLGYSFNGVAAVANDLKTRLEHIARVRDVRITASPYAGASERGYQVVLDPNRGALARYGLTASDFARAVGREVRGPVGSTLLAIGGNELAVTVKAAGARDRTLDELENAIVPTRSGAPARIGNLSAVAAREALGLITREDQQYVRFVSYDFRGPQQLATRTHSAFLKAISVPSGYRVIDVTNSVGNGSDRSERGLYLVFALGITMVVLVVALVFDSVWGAWMAFLSLPLALAGVGAAFWAFGAAFAREAAVGVILVVGLAAHQTILLVHAALEKRRAMSSSGSGSSLGAAQVLRAAVDRAGMIMLVTLTSLASLAPLSLGNHANTLFGSIALATAGGTVAGTLAALFVVPALLVGRRRGPGRGSGHRVGGPLPLPSPS